MSGTRSTPTATRYTATHAIVPARVQRHVSWAARASTSARSGISGRRYRGTRTYPPYQTTPSVTAIPARSRASPARAGSRRRRPSPVTTRTSRSATAAAGDQRDRPGQGPRQVGRLVRAGADAEEHGEEVEEQDPRGLGAREVALKARPGRERRPVVASGCRPRRAGSRGTNAPRPSHAARRSGRRGSTSSRASDRGDERVDDLEVEVEAEPSGEAHRDRDPAPRGLRERPGEPERRAEEHHLARPGGARRSTSGPACSWPRRRRTPPS